MTSPIPSVPAGVKVLSVSELTAYVRQLLEDAVPVVWVTGEISNYRPHQSGHLYFDLKDNKAQLHALIWRSTAQWMRFALQNGLEVIARGRLSVYPPQGRYQLIVDELHPKGQGALELAFRQLKEKLLARGWFADERKKPLPRFPRRIAIVTSPTGAAIRDMLQIIPRRWPAAEIWVCPVAVQGNGAAQQIANAIRLLNQFSAVDVMIVGRGGGSLEDLWAFNEETVAEAIFQSRIPVISAVGHQLDYTIADFVADRRAATPSEAAEIVVPDHVLERQAINDLHRQLTQRLRACLTAAREQLDGLARRRALRQPLERIRDCEQQLDAWAERGRLTMQRYLDRTRRALQADAARLDSLSPLNVLGRGYSVTWKATGPGPLRSAADVSAGERIVTRLCQGELVSRVEEVHPGEPRRE